MNLHRGRDTTIAVAFTPSPNLTYAVLRDRENGGPGYGRIESLRHLFENWVSRIMGHRFVHCEICYDIPSQSQNGTVQAHSVQSNTGVYYERRSYSSREYTFVILSLPTKNLKYMQNFLKKHENSGYDSHGARRCLTGPRSTPHWRDKAEMPRTNWYCTEFVVTALKIAGFLPHVTPNAITTDELYSEICNHVYCKHILEKNTPRGRRRTG